jgi:exodeoxyribonuclease V alpha subunit
VPRNTEQESIDFILKSITESIPKKYNLDPIKDIAIASPGKKSLVGVVNLNKEIRKTLNPTAKSPNLSPGDKVVYRNNDRNLGLVNGDTGIIQDIQDGKCIVDFGSGAGHDGSGIVKVPEDKWPLMHLAFCTTVHVTQGSETPCIITPMHQCHYSLLIRNLIFTAMTRARKLTVIVGEPKALTRAINNNSPEMRYTGLCSLIKKYFQAAKIEVAPAADIPLASN